VFGYAPFSASPFSSQAGSVFNASVLETATALDTISAFATFPASVQEQAAGSDTVSALIDFACLVAEQTSAADSRFCV
jgi:hypothetical protein